MKFKNRLKKAMLLLTAFGLAVSCENNDVDVFGSADLKVVNAAPNSGSQRFILANIPEISNLSYLEHSVGYLKVASGNKLVAEFRDQNDNDLYAKKEYDLNDKGNYTIFLTGSSTTDADIKLFQDDLSSPSSGKARVKFIHLSTGAPSSIDFRNAEGIILTSNLGRYAQSSYIEITAGSFAIGASASGETSALTTLPASDFSAGKIYTVFISGSPESGYTVKKLLLN